MPKKANGEGSVYRRKDGRWVASLRLNGVRRTVYARSEREARAKLRELQGQVAVTGALPNPGTRTVADLVEEWLASASTLKPSTAAQYREFFDRYARARLGHVRLAKVTPDALQRLYAGLSPSVGEKLHRILHRAFAVAVLWRWLPDNPCDRVLKPAYKPARKTLWSRAELDAFLQGTAEHWLNPLFVLLASTGMRLGEALALRWENVGLGGVAVTVTGTLHRLEGEYVVSKPKTASAERTVLLPPVAIAALTRQKAQQDACHDTGFVFTGETGQPLHASTVQHAMKRECERLGLPAVTPHGLRHLHASLLLDEGIPVTAVSARLGHANPNITMQTYAHALAGQDGQAAQAIAAALPETIESRHEVGLGVDTEWER